MNAEWPRRRERRYITAVGSFQNEVCTQFSSCRKKGKGPSRHVMASAQTCRRNRWRRSSNNRKSCFDDAVPHLLVDNQKIIYVKINIAHLWRGKLCIESHYKKKRKCCYQWRQQPNRMCWRIIFRQRNKNAVPSHHIVLSLCRVTTCVVSLITDMSHKIPLRLALCRRSATFPRALEIRSWYRVLAYLSIHFHILLSFI